MDQEQLIRKQLVTLLNSEEAHMCFAEAVADFPAEFMNTRPPNVSYTPWHLLEHMRLAQWDILDFIRNPKYVAPEWPAGYWPPTDSEADPIAWHNTIKQFESDRRALQNLVLDLDTDLYVPIPHGQGQTIFREILVVSDHNAYHLGEFAILRQVMSTWPKGRTR
jgi:hypothetical protein